MCILVVEDEPELRRQLQTMLKAAGYAVDSAGDGRSGLFMGSEYPFSTWHSWILYPW